MPDISIMTPQSEAEEYDFTAGILHAYKTEAPDDAFLQKKLQDFHLALSLLKESKATGTMTGDDSLETTCQHRIDEMYTILRRYRQLARLLEHELLENLKDADHYELHKDTHAKLNQIAHSVKKAGKMAKVMDWKLNGIVETDNEGNELYNPSDLAAELQVQTVY